MKFLTLYFLSGSLLLFAADPPKPFNTQKLTTPLLKPATALASMTVRSL